MQNSISILSEIYFNAEAQNTFISAISLIFTILAFRPDKSYETKKERFEKLVSPLFFMLEPYLYKDISSEYLQKVLSFIENNKLYADANLLEQVYYYKENPTKENYNRLCKCVDRLYDEYSFTTSLKLRSAEYRCKRKQYNTKKTPLIFHFLSALNFVKTPIITYFLYVFIFNIGATFLEEHTFIAYAIFFVFIGTLIKWPISLFFSQDDDNK